MRGTRFTNALPQYKMQSNKFALVMTNTTDLSHGDPLSTTNKLWAVAWNCPTEDRTWTKEIKICKIYDNRAHSKWCQPPVKYNIETNFTMHPYEGVKMQKLQNFLGNIVRTRQPV